MWEVGIKSIISSNLPGVDPQKPEENLPGMYTHYTLQHPTLHVATHTTQRERESRRGGI